MVYARSERERTDLATVLINNTVYAMNTFHSKDHDFQIDGTGQISLSPESTEEISSALINRVRSKGGAWQRRGRSSVFRRSCLYRGQSLMLCALDV
jgi:hypothetical protein